MTDITVGITLKADGSGLVGEVKLSREELERLQAAAKGVGPAANAGAQGVDRLGREARDARRDLERLSAEGRGVAASFGSVRNVLAAGGIFIGVTEVVNFGREILDTAGKMQTLETRIAAFVGRGDALAETMDFIATTAQRQSQNIFTVAESYSKLLPLVDSGVISMTDARDILTGFNDVAARTGATSAQLGQTMFGLSQGLSAGVVRAEELNQVTEPLPGLLQALDRASGQAAGGFRRMVVDGQVTSDFLRTTLIDALKEYEGAAEETAGNLEASATRFSTAWDLATARMSTNFRDNTAATLSFGATLLDGLREMFGEGDAGGGIEVDIVVKSGELAEAEARLAELRDAAAPRADGLVDVKAAINAKAAADEVRELTAELEAMYRQLHSGGLPGGDRGTTTRVGTIRPEAGGGGGPSADLAKVTAAIDAQIAAEQRLAAARGEGRTALRAALIENQAAVLVAKAKVAAGSDEADVLRGLAVQLVDLSLAEEAYTEAKRRQADATQRATDAAQQELRDREAASARAQALIQSYDQLGQSITRDVMTPQEAYNDSLRQLDFLLQTDRISLETYGRAVRQAGDTLADADEDAADFKESMRDAGQAIGTAFEDAIVNGASFRDMLAGLEQDIIRIATRLAITKPLENALGDFLGGVDFGSIFSGGTSSGGATASARAAGAFGNAHGNAFDRGRLMPFARGGVVDRPVLFPMARGMGLMGEAGPEAVLPLRRGPNGDLGVQASGAGGGGTVVQVIDQRGAGAPPIEERRSRTPDGRELVQLVVKQMKGAITSGALDREMGTAYGLSRQGVGR